MGAKRRESIMCKLMPDAQKVNISEPERMIAGHREALDRQVIAMMGAGLKYLSTRDDADAYAMGPVATVVAGRVERLREIIRAMSEAAVRSDGTASGDVPVFAATVPEAMS
jgi:hypothetical protein